MKTAKLIPSDRNRNGQFVQGHSGGPGRGNLGSGARVKRGTITRGWHTKARILRLAASMENDGELSVVMTEFAKADPGGYCRWISSMTPDFPSEAAKPEIDLIAQAGFSPQDLIEQIETARLQASAIEQPTIVKPNVPDPTPDPD